MFELHLICQVGARAFGCSLNTLAGVWVADRKFPTLRVESRRPHASEEAPIDSLLTLCSSSTSADVFQAAFFRHTINNVRNIRIFAQSEGQAQAPAREIGTSYVVNDDLQFSLSTTRSPRAFTYPLRPASMLPLCDNPPPHATRYKHPSPRPRYCTSRCFNTSSSLLWAW